MTGQGRDPFRVARFATLTAAMALVAASGWWTPGMRAAQGPAGARGGSQRLTIPYLANALKPADLDFAAAQCDISADGAQMDCRFRQLFLTVSGVDAASCAITTNGYDRTFRRESPVRWVSADPPAGACGVVETTTLDDGGTTRWTMTIKSAATQNVDTPECQAAAREIEVYDWRTVKRRLPCAFVQPGAIER